MEGKQVGAEFGGGRVTPGRLRLTGFVHYAAELLPLGAVGEVGQCGQRFGEALTVFAGGDFVEDFAQAVEIGLGFARAFRRLEALCADHRLRYVHMGHGADVGELGHTAHEDDVGGLDVAVDKAPAVEEFQRVRQCHTYSQTLGIGETAGGAEAGGEGEGRVGLPIANCQLPRGGVGLRISAWCGGVIRQLHHVVEVAGGRVDADVEEVHQAIVRAGDWLEAADAGKFAFVIAGVREGGAVDHLDGAEGVEGVAGQPDFAKGALADAAEELVIRNGRWRLVRWLGG